jgi:hypothetical protein
VEPTTQSQTNRFLESPGPDQTETQVGFMSAANPMKEGEAGYFSEPDFFEHLPGSYGDGFMFDAVMATAGGACEGD